MFNTDSLFPQHRKIATHLNHVRWVPSLWAMVVITAASLAQHHVVRFWPYVFIPLLLGFITQLHLACQEAMKNEAEDHYNSLSMLAEFFEFPAWAIIFLSNGFILAVYYKIADAAFLWLTIGTI